MTDATTQTPTAATPPEELAGTVMLNIRLAMQIPGWRAYGEKAIAAAIRQHSEGLRAENERLSDESDKISTIEVQAVTLFRWLSYTQNSMERRRGIKGRWQQLTENGWWSTPLPEGGKWRISPPAPHPGTEKARRDAAQEGGK